ncbi:MAG: hypothetical protein KAT48_09155 [Bacteroidales bacterium]|nr:hypothetical protein [Bacteroidales bacterium]
MVITLVVFLFIFLVLLFVLFTPLIVNINTEDKLYDVRLKGVLRLYFSFEGGVFQVKGTMFLIPFTIRAFKAARKEDKKSKRGLKNFYDKLAGLKTAPMLLRYIFKGLKTFNIRYFRVNFDTDDFVRNAQLVPYITYLNTRYENMNLSINFTGESFAIMMIQNRIYKLLIVAVKYLINKHKRKK